MAHKTFTLDGEEFTGQDIDGVDVEHLGIDAKGDPIRQARLRFMGGEMTAQQGDYIATFPNGYRIVVPASVWDAKAKEAPKKEAPKPKAKKAAPKPAPVVTPTTYSSAYGTTTPYVNPWEKK